MSLALLDNYSDSESSAEEEEAPRKITTTPVSPLLQHEVQTDTPDAPPVADETSMMSSPETSHKSAHVADAVSANPSNVRASESAVFSITDGEIPSDLARELRNAGHAIDLSDMVHIDAASSTAHPHTPAHISHRAMQNTTSRLAHHISKDSVSRIARRKHQITALAADAIAMQTAQNALPTSQTHHKTYK